MSTRTLAPRDYAKTIRRSLINGTITVLILHRAQHEPVYGGALTKALRKFGYVMSPGTLYPSLHTLERAKLLRSRTTTVQGRVRRYYEITPFGRDCYKEARDMLAILVQELLSEQDPRTQPGRAR
jgi:DNA-binding PadR family transcriptional regulator